MPRCTTHDCIHDHFAVKTAQHFKQQPLIGDSIKKIAAMDLTSAKPAKFQAPIKKTTSSGITTTTSGVAMAPLLTGDAAAVKCSISVTNPVQEADEDNTAFSVRKKVYRKSRKCDDAKTTISIIATASTF